MGLQLLFTYQPWMQAWFGTAALPWGSWGPILLGGSQDFFLSVSRSFASAVQSVP